MTMKRISVYLNTLMLFQACKSYADLTANTKSEYHNSTIMSSKTKFNTNNGFDILSKQNILEPSLETETSKIDFKWTTSSSSSQNLRKTSSDDNIVIYVLGDIPYTQQEARLLSKQIQNIPSDARFIVHVGDIMSSESGCPEEWYIDVKKILLQSSKPVFITPGDNDWSDCPNPSKAWDYWFKHFSRFDNKFSHDLPVVRQSRRIENAAFFLDDYALFIQVHLVGVPVLNEDEWDERIQDCIDFTVSQISKYQNKLSVVVIFGHTKPRSEHDNYFKPLYKIAKTLNKPIFYIHGDGHVFSVDANVEGLTNFVDIEVDQGRKAPPLKVIIQRDAMKVAREY